jgi:hypothetical protein
MKRISALVGLLFSVAFLAQAQEAPKVHYFVQLGGNLIVPGGDFDGTRVAHIDPDGDTNVVLEEIAIPKLPVFPLASMRLGVNIDASSLTMNFGYGRPMLKEFPLSLPVAPQHGKWIDFGVEYQYHFLYPAVVRPLIGANYGFTRLNASDATRVQTGTSVHSNNVLYYGTGPGVVAGVGWFDLVHLSANVEARGRYVSVEHFTTGDNNYGMPTKIVRLWMMDMGLSVQYIF